MQGINKFVIRLGNLLSRESYFLTIRVNRTLRYNSILSFFSRINFELFNLKPHHELSLIHARRDRDSIHLIIHIYSCH